MLDKQIDPILRLPEVMRATGRCRASIYADMKIGMFPKQIKLGKNARSVGWRTSDINAWIEDCSNC